MYKIIRFGHGFDPAIIVSPPDAGPDTPDAKYYRCELWQKHNSAPRTIEEIDKKTAMRYFSGQADGMGFEAIPQRIFPSLETVLQYITETANERERKELEKRGIRSEEDWEKAMQEFRELMRGYKDDPNR